MKSEIFHKLLFIPFILILLHVACKQQPPAKETRRLSDKEKEEMLLRVNKYLVNKDIELIEAYAEQNNWDMKVSETGLFYEILHRTDGRKVQQGDLVKISYEVRLLDGSVCYTSDQDGPMELIIGKSQIISGLEQGLLMMRNGEKARFIIPPHIGYGLIGDEERIPARSIIIYIVEIEEIQ